MLKELERVREDFDRIALTQVRGDDVPQPFDAPLLGLVPADCRTVLDLGCGTGRLARRLAPRVRKVTAVDFSTEMLRVARQRSRGFANIEFRQANILDLNRGPETYDCVISAATLHHLPLEEAVAIMKAAVAPGGVLILHDLRQTDGAFDRALDGARLAVKGMWLLESSARLRAFLRERNVWATHARGEVYLTARGVEQLRDTHFAGATLMQHFLWRYTIVWRKADRA